MIEHVHPGDLKDWAAKAQAHGRPLILDVREPSELQQASIQPDAAYDLVAIPMGVIPPRLHELDPTRPVACMCHHGGRSMRVAQFLERVHDLLPVVRVGLACVEEGRVTRDGTRQDHSLLLASGWLRCQALRHVIPTETLSVHGLC